MVAPKNTIITLLVKAEEIYNATSPSEEFILERCALRADDGTLLYQKNSEDQWNIKEGAIDVYKAKNVRWEGEAVESLPDFDILQALWKYDVAITEIEYQGNDDNYFNTVRLIGTGGRNGKVIQLTKSSGYSKGPYYYTIKFRIYAQGNNYKDFEIDPKLEIQQ